MNAPNDEKPKLFTWATVSDITFAILVCKNYYYKWITLEQYVMDNKGAEHPHKGKIKGKYSKGNMLSGPEGQARYAEIRKRLVQIAEDKKLKEQYESAFTEKFREQRLSARSKPYRSAGWLIFPAASRFWPMPVITRSASPDRARR